MANVKQLKHLEHLEDEMLNYGVEGCKAAVSFLQELRKMLGCDDSKGFMQTKWDGAPSIICGKEPYLGNFLLVLNLYSIKLLKSIIHQEILQETMVVLLQIN